MFSAPKCSHIHFCTLSHFLASRKGCRRDILSPRATEVLPSRDFESIMLKQRNKAPVTAWAHSSYRSTIMLGKDVSVSITSERYKMHVFTQPFVMFPRRWEQYCIDQKPELPSPLARCFLPTMLSEPSLYAATHLCLSGD